MGRYVCLEKKNSDLIGPITCNWLCCITFRLKFKERFWNYQGKHLSKHETRRRVTITLLLFYCTLKRNHRQQRKDLIFTEYSFLKFVKPIKQRPLAKSANSFPISKCLRSPSMFAWPQWTQSWSSPSSTPPQANNSSTRSSRRSASERSGMLIYGLRDEVVISL